MVTNGVLILRQAKTPLGRGTLNSELAAGRLRLIRVKRNCDSNLLRAKAKAGGTKVKKQTEN